MLSTTIKSLWAHRLRLAMSAVSIVLGVAFVSGSLMFTSLLSSVFDQIVSSASADVNVFREQELLDLDQSGAGQPLLPPDMSAKAADVAGVTRVEPVVSSSSVYPLDKQDRLLTFGNAPGVASNWHDAPAVDGAIGPRLVEGRAPENVGEVAIDPSTVSRGQYVIGDAVKISTPYDGVRTFTLVGLATYGSGSTGGANYLFFTMDDIRDIVLQGKEGYTGLWIVTDEGDADSAAKAIANLLPHGYTAETGASLAETIRETLDVGLGFINVFLLTFAAIALVVASLLILNTFSILVAQRARELAILRAVGATRGQIMRSMLLEAGVVGVVGSAAGIALGYTLVWGILILLGAFGADFGAVTPQLTVPALVVSLGVGVLLTVAAAVLPARRACATRPVEAMANAARTDSPTRAPIVGIALLELGVAGIVCAVWLPVPQRLVWLGVGAALLIVGTVLATAVLGSPVVSVLRKVFGWLFGETGRLAGLNAVRQPARTAGTAATLMIGLSLVTAVAILAASTTASIRDQLTLDQRGDFTVTPLAGQPFDAKVAREAEQVPGVRAAHPFYTGPSMLGDKPVTLTGLSDDALGEATALEVTGSLSADGDVAPALVSTKIAAEHDLALGKMFALPTPTGESVEVLVTGIFPDEAASGVGDIVVTPESFERLGDTTVVTRVIVVADEGADVSAVRSGLDAVVKSRPTVVVSDVDEYIQARIDRFNQIFSILYGLLALAVVISVLGIVNTLSLSVAERTREVGLLRAVGMTRPQVRAMVRLEAVIVATVGALLGIAIGVVCGSALVHLLVDEGVHLLRVPWIQLAIFVVVAAGVGVLAAVAPARRAAKLNVLDAIAMQ